MIIVTGIQVGGGSASWKTLGGRTTQIPPRCIKAELNDSSRNAVTT